MAREVRRLAEPPEPRVAGDPLRVAVCAAAPRRQAQMASNLSSWFRLLAYSAGIHTTPVVVDAEIMNVGTNVIVVKVFQDFSTNTWSVNPTFFQAKLLLPMTGAGS